MGGWAAWGFWVVWVHSAVYSIQRRETGKFCILLEILYFADHPRDVKVPTQFLVRGWRIG